MARISKVEVERRSAIAVEFFKNHPEAAVATFNKVLVAINHPSSTPENEVKEKMMNTKTAYALRAQARAEIGWTGKEESVGSHGGAPAEVKDVPGLSVAEARALAVEVTNG